MLTALPYNLLLDRYHFLKRIPMPVGVSVVFDEDGGGWYAEVFGHDGKELAVLPSVGTYATAQACNRAIDRYCAEYGFSAVRC